MNILRVTSDEKYDEYVSTKGEGITWLCWLIKKEIPFLPKGLRVLNCNGNDLTALPKLPKTLLRLYCSNNKLTVLPKLPKGLLYLYFENNLITDVPDEFPEDLEALGYQGNKLKKIPKYKNQKYHCNHCGGCCELPKKKIEK